jgi:uncharacterized protein YegP (UPF0339 family)
MFRRSFLAAMLLPVVALAARAADTMTFEVYADVKGEFRWRLLDKDGTNVANSGQGYVNKADCAKMVENFKADLTKYSFEVYTDNAKKTRFRIKSRNGNVVGASTGAYETEADAKKVMSAIEKGCASAKVKEVEKK